MVMKRTCSPASSRNAPVKCVVTVNQACKLRQAYNTIDRHIGHMRVAEKRHHVVFAVRVESNIAHQDEIIVTARFTERAIEYLNRALVVSLIDFFVGTDHALGCFQQAFARWIIAGIGNQRANGGFRLLTRGPRLDRRGRRPHMVGQALLRPRLYIGVLRVHDGSLRSTGTQRYRAGLAASLTDPDRLRVHTGAWT